MPEFIAAIPNTYHSIDNKIFHSITRDLRNAEWLPNYRRMEVIRDGFKSKTRGSTIYKGTKRKWKHNDIQMKVSVSTESGPSNISHFRTSDGYIEPIFQDKSIGIEIRPQYDERLFTMQFTVRSASRELLTSWSNLVRARTQRQDNRLEHSLEYSYTLETQSHQLLKQIYNMRETIAGYEETYPQWIDKHSSNSLSAVEAGNTFQLEYTEKQIEVIGYFGVKPEPEITEVQDGLWEGVMSYVFTANLPHALHHIYPIMTHQQLMPWKFLEEPQRDYRNVMVFNPIMRGFTEVDRERTGLINTINIPSLDQGYTPSLPDGYYPLVTAMMQLDEDTDILCNLHDLEDVELDIGVLKILKNYYHQFLTQPYNSPFLVTLHSNRNLLQDNYIFVDHDLNVKLRKTIDKRRVYRVSFSIIVKPHRLSHNAMVPLKDNTRVKALLADTINNIDDDMSYTKELVNSWLLPNDFDDYFYLNNVLKSVQDGVRWGFESEYGHGGLHNWGGGGEYNYNVKPHRGVSPKPYVYNPDDYPAGGWYGDSWSNQMYYHSEYRKLYGRSVYGNNTYTDIDDRDYTGSGIDHPDHDIHEYDPDHPEYKDTRRRTGRAIVNRFTVMTTIVHSFASGQVDHKPEVIREVEQNYIGDNNGNS